MNTQILVIAEHDNHSVALDTFKTLSAAAQIGEDISVLVMGYQCQEVIECIGQCDIVKQVIVADNEQFSHLLAENGAPIAVQLAKDFTHILAPATTFGKNMLPRIAALLDVGQLSDVVEIVTADTVIRPIYAGNALAKVKSTEEKILMTIRGSAFEAVGLEPANQVPVIAVGGHDVGNGLSAFVSQQQNESERPELAAASVVISGGRGVGSKDNFALVEQLADKLGGAIGASRAAVDAGFVSNDLQVGQTGKIVAPDLYIAIGISGAIQHMAGMKDSKVIVAINSDPEAPIFQVADYGLVGDLFDIMPELIDKVP